MSEPIRIGGTRAASILGVGFQTPLEVWAEMTGKVEREDISNLEHIEAGQFMEDAAAKWFEHRTGIKVIAQNPMQYTDRQYPWLAGSPDRLLFFGPDSTSYGILECKNTHGMAKRDWHTSDNPDAPVKVPLGYQVQLQTYLRITGFEIGYFAAIVGGNHLETPRMDRDEDFIAAMLEELERFIREHVQADIPPPVTGRDLGVLKRLFPKDTGETRTANMHAPESLALKELIKVKAEIKALEKARDEAQAILCASMKDATELVTPYGKATWKWQTAHHAAREARVIESRVLRTKEE